MVARRKLLVVLLLTFCFYCSVESRQPSDDGEGHSAPSVVTDDDGTIQNNPNYTEPMEATEDSSEEKAKVAKESTKIASKTEMKAVIKKDNEKKVNEAAIMDVTNEIDEKITSSLQDEGEDAEEYSDYDDDYDEEQDKESDKSVKEAVAQALSNSRNATRYTMKFVKKHRLKLTIAAALFAFRKEIGRILYLSLTKPQRIDPATGRVLSRTINISPTSALKVLLFLDLMRKLNTGEVSDSGPMGSKRSLLFKLLHPSNTAFVPPIEQHWTFEKINERYTKDEMAFQKAMGASGAGVSVGQSLRSFASNSILGIRGQGKQQDLVLLLDWTKLTESIDQMSSLRDQVSFLLSQHRANNKLTTNSASNITNSNVTETTEIIVMLESPGGAAADYGLAAQMLLRLSHEPGLIVTVCVDKVAASGGYMIACASSPGRLYAAPFSVLGSIGVVGSAINIHNVLQGWGVKPLVFRGGKNKAPVGLIGEVTKDGMKQVQSMVDATHVAFKRHVVAARPVLLGNINKVATGEVWLGYEALNVGLVDRIITSDEYIGERILQGARVLRLVKYNKPRFLFPSHTSRLSLLHPIEILQKTVRAIMAEFAQVIQKTSTTVDVSTGSIPAVATDERLTSAVTSLGSSIQQPHCGKMA